MKLDIVDRLRRYPGTDMQDAANIIEEMRDTITQLLNESSPCVDEDTNGNDYECWDHEEITSGLACYDDAKEEDQQWVRITSITVPTEFDKEQLLKAFHYIHNLRCINTDWMAVNTIAHLYQQPELIAVKHEKI